MPGRSTGVARFFRSRQVTRPSAAANPVPGPCAITRLAKGRVYYRNPAGFLPATSPETFGTDTVKEWADSEPEAD